MEGTLPFWYDHAVESKPQLMQLRLEIHKFTKLLEEHTYFKLSFLNSFYFLTETSMLVYLKPINDINYVHKTVVQFK